MPHSPPGRPRRTFIRFMALALATMAGAGHATDLTVEVSGARSTRGTVGAVLYDSADAWLKTPLKRQAVRAPAAPVTVLVFQDLPPGRYALSAFHDENDNGKVDVNVLGVPTERIGFSREATGHMGPASFEDAALDVQGDMAAAITLR